MEKAIEEALLKDRYRIVRELGKGAMGIVYLAQDEQLLSKPVVIKVLSENFSGDDWIRRKFRQEIEALTRVDHPGVVGVIDAGEVSDGRPFVVMQYIEGGSLRALMSQPMEFERISSYVKQLGPALAAVHAQGILHRDLKPENIMVQKLAGGDEQLKLIDFGLAKVRASKMGESSVAENVVGSFGYMSPEQLTGKQLSPASDVYSLAVIAYEMITGEMPFHPESVFELYEKQKAEELVAPQKFRNDLSPSAQAVILKSLSFDPEKRNQSALDFCNELSASLLSSATVTQSIPSAEAIPRAGAKPLLPAVMIHFVGLLYFLKLYFFRFESWRSFLLEPAFLFASAFAVIAFLLIRKIQISRGFFALLLVGAGAWLAPILFLPPVIRISNRAGALSDTNAYTLNYSDPRGYKYVRVESNFCLITITPGGFNRLSDYKVQLTLSPPLEFSDVYFDKDFHLSQQLGLQPSSTNDILLLERRGDSFYSIRSIAVRYKYRIRESDNRITVTLTSGDREISREQKLPL